MSKVVTFGEIMLRLSPPGFERFLQIAGVRRHLRRRRGQRRRQPRAVRARQPLRDAPAGARDRRRGGAGAARRRRAHRLHRPRRRSHRHLLRRGRRQPARLDGHLRPRPLGDQRDDAGRRRLGRRSSPARPGSTPPASRRRSAPTAAACTKEALEAARKAGVPRSASTSTSARSSGPRSRRRR